MPLLSHENSSQRRTCPLRLTIVHHDEALRKFFAELAAAQRWCFDAHDDFANAVAGLEVPVPGSGDAAPATAPSAAAPCKDVTPLTHSTYRGLSARPAAARAHVLLAALRPPKGPCGMEWVRRLAALDGDRCLVVLAEQSDAALGFSALYCGASAFILLPLKRVELLAAIQGVAIGWRLLPAAAAEASRDALYHPPPARSCTGLTPTEIKVLWTMAEGRGEKHAGVLLGIETRTVHAHLNHIYVKLQVHSLKQAIDKVFSKRGCPYACVRREREREGKSRGQTKRERSPR
jgi:DNA-binding NarL/FixJ family response regulator